MSTEQPEENPGHLIPPEEWERVQEEAEREAQRIGRGQPPPEAPQQRGRTTGVMALSGQVSARRHGGRRAGGAPTFGVLHSAETPLRPGYAAAIARYFRDSAPTSCHYMTDPAETWGVLDDVLVAWHCGTGNTNSVGLEQAGRAAMTRADWLSLEGMAQLRRNAAVMQACRRAYGIGLWWMTDAQLRDAHARRIVGGWATHDQCRRVLGGTTHTDPGGGFPLDVQMQLANGGRMATLDQDDLAAIGKVVQSVVWDAVDNGGKGPDGRMGHMLQDTHKTSRAVYDLLTGVNEGGRDGKRISRLRKIAEKLGAL
jgi:hypothetical protein